MKLRIVAIDDEIEYLQLIEEFALMSSYECLSFNGYDNHVLKQLNDFDLIFLDIHMPNKDGIDILMELDRTGFKGGIIVLSGAEEGVVHSVLKLGNSLNLKILGHLPKPFLLRDFRNTITSFEISRDQSVSDSQKIDDLNVHADHLEDYLSEKWLYPVYQPQIDPQSDKLRGLECLSRMTHPEYGNVPPPVFIEYFDKSGHIGQYTLLLIDTALNECSAILSEDPLLAISFNISASSLTQEFTNNLIELVTSNSVNTSQITLEITETFAITLSQDALYAVSKIRASGMNLSVDDFGTGYSTITQLNELPFNELKVDKSFVDDITTNSKTQSIVNATVILAKSLGLKVVAEGVETQEQLDLVKEIGCTVVQGYIYSKPLTFDQLEKYVKHHHSKSE